MNNPEAPRTTGGIPESLETDSQQESPIETQDVLVLTRTDSLSPLLAREVAEAQIAEKNNETYANFDTTTKLGKVKKIVSQIATTIRTPFQTKSLAREIEFDDAVQDKVPVHAATVVDAHREGILFSGTKETTVSGQDALATLFITRVIVPLVEKPEVPKAEVVQKKVKEFVSVALKKDTWKSYTPEKRKEIYAQVQKTFGSRDSQTGTIANFDTTALEAFIQKEVTEGSATQEGTTSVANATYKKYAKMQIVFAHPDCRDVIQGNISNKSKVIAGMTRLLGGERNAAIETVGTAVESLALGAVLAKTAAKLATASVAPVLVPAVNSMVSGSVAYAKTAERLKNEARTMQKIHTVKPAEDRRLQEGKVVETWQNAQIGSVKLGKIFQKHPDLVKHMGGFTSLNLQELVTNPLEHIDSVSAQQRAGEFAEITAWLKKDKNDAVAISESSVTIAKEVYFDTLARLDTAHAFSDVGIDLLPQEQAKTPVAIKQELVAYKKALQEHGIEISADDEQFYRGEKDSSGKYINGTINKPMQEAAEIRAREIKKFICKQSIKTGMMTAVAGGVVGGLLSQPVGQQLAEVRKQLQHIGGEVTNHIGFGPHTPPVSEASRIKHPKISASPVGFKTITTTEKTTIGTAWKHYQTKSFNSFGYKEGYTGTFGMHVDADATTYFAPAESGINAIVVEVPQGFKEGYHHITFVGLQTTQQDGMPVNAFRLDSKTALQYLDKDGVVQSMTPQEVAQILQVKDGAINATISAGEITNLDKANLIVGKKAIVGDGIDYVSVASQEGYNPMVDANTPIAITKTTTIPNESRQPILSHKPHKTTESFPLLPIELTGLATAVVGTAVFEGKVRKWEDLANAKKSLQSLSNKTIRGIKGGYTKGKKFMTEIPRSTAEYWATVREDMAEIRKAIPPLRNMEPFTKERATKLIARIPKIPEHIQNIWDDSQTFQRLDHHKRKSEEALALSRPKLRQGNDTVASFGETSFAEETGEQVIFSESGNILPVQTPIVEMDENNVSLPVFGGVATHTTEHEASEDTTGYFGMGSTQEVQQPMEEPMPILLTESPVTQPKKPTVRERIQSTLKPFGDIFKREKKEKAPKKAKKPQKNTAETAQPTLPDKQVAYESRASSGHPERNEDSFFANELAGTVAVFDGVGGSNRGEVASAIARDTFQQVLTNPELKNIQNDIETAMQLGWETARATIATKETEGGEAYKGMATTCTVAKVYRDTQTGQQQLTYLQSGDSRLYIRKTDGSMRQMTQDDSLWTEFRDKAMVRAIEEAFEEADGINDFSFQGLFIKYYNASQELRKVVDGYEQSPEGSKKMIKFWQIGRTVIKKSLDAKAIDSQNYQIKTIALEDTDKDIFLTSDGVSDNLKRSEMEAISKQNSSIEQFISSLVNDTTDTFFQDSTRGRQKYDDITAVGLHIAQKQQREVVSDRETSFDEESFDLSTEIAASGLQFAIESTQEDKARLTRMLRKEADGSIVFRGEAGAITSKELLIAAGGEAGMENVELSFQEFDGTQTTMRWDREKKYWIVKDERPYTITWNEVTKDYVRTEEPSMQRYRINEKDANIFFFGKDLTGQGSFNQDCDYRTRPDLKGLQFFDKNLEGKSAVYLLPYLAENTQEVIQEIDVVGGNYEAMGKVINKNKYNILNEELVQLLTGVLSVKGGFSLMYYRYRTIDPDTVRATVMAKILEEEVLHDTLELLDQGGIMDEWISLHQKK